MEKKDTIKQYAEEAVEIIRDVVINNELVKGEFINKIDCNENGHVVFIQDILNNKVEYSLSEVSYIFTDYLDCFGDIHNNVYETVLNSTKCENYNIKKDLFIKSLTRLKEIEACV